MAVESAAVQITRGGGGGVRDFVRRMQARGDTIRTDRNGVFAAERLTPGRGQRLDVRHEDFESGSLGGLDLEPGSTTKGVRVVLRRGLELTGTISGLPEEQLAGISVNASGSDGYFASTRAAADATFELTGVPEGSISLHANAGSFMSGTRTADANVTIGPGQAEAFAEIVFEAGYRIEVRVSRSGQPVPDAFVNAFPESGGGRSAGARTDEFGSCVLEGLQDGSYNLMANVQGGSTVRKTVALSGDTTVDLDVPPARIAGSVVEAGTGQPLSDVTVRVEEGGSGLRFASAVTSDSAGRFALEDIEARAYQLTFQKPAYETETREVNAADDREVRVEMRRGQGLGLVARDGIFGTPLRGLMVRVVDGSGNAVFSGSVPLDSQGRGEVPSVKPGSYELRISSSGYAPVSRPGIMVPSSELAFALTPGGTLEIQVGPETQARPGAQGRLYSGGRPYLSSIFSTDGIIRLGSPVRRFENVAPGSYVLAVDGGSRQEVEMREGGLAVVTLP